MCTSGLVWLLVIVNGAFGAILPSVLWSLDNPVLKKFIDTPRKVMPMDTIFFVCPNPFDYPVKRELTYSKEKLYENIYLVDKVGYDTCNASGASTMMIIECNDPLKLLHSSVVFQRMSATQNDPEFMPGKEYYFIGTASGNLSSLANKVGGHCSEGMKMKVYVCTGESDPKCPGGNRVVNGSWSSWGQCIDGTQSRECNSPAPENGGLPCCGNSTRSCTPSTQPTVSSTDFPPPPSKANRTGADSNTPEKAGSLKTSTVVIICMSVFVLGLCLGGVVILLLYRRFRQRETQRKHPVSSTNPDLPMKDPSRLSEISSRPSSVLSTASESTRMI